MIILIDDNKAFRDTFQQLVEYTSGALPIQSFPSSEAYFSTPYRTAANLVVIDIFMPGLDGFETARRIRQNDPNIPVLHISSHISSNIKTLSRKSGAFACIQKDELARKLPELLQKYVTPCT
ncbi:MAG: response regulator [Fidelibacterota bacterium]